MSLCPGFPGYTLRRKSTCATKKGGLPAALSFMLELEGSLDFHFGSQRLDEIDQLAADLGVVDLHEGAVEL